jgi:type I restriction enzyme S subunit
VPIADFCETGSGGTPSRSKEALYFGGPIPWVKSGELRENTIVKTEETITALGLRESAAKLLPRGALLVALYGATVGRVGILGMEAATNQAVCHIIPDQRRADRQYLFYALQAQVSAWLSRRVGGGQPNISQGIIRETLIPLPPLEDQKRIAYLLSKVEGLITQRKQHLQQLDDLLKSVFLTMFGDPVQNDKGWDTAALDQFCERVVDCPHSTPTYSDKPTGNYCVRSSDDVSSRRRNLHRTNSTIRATNW